MPILPYPRITLFADDGVSGWSESYYDMTATSLSAAIGTANTNLIPARQACMADGPILKYARASYDYVFRDAQIVFIPPPGTRNTLGQYINNNAFTNAKNQQPVPASWDFGVALYRGINSDIYRCLRPLSGIPFYDMEDVSAIITDAPFLNAYDEFIQCLTGTVAFNGQPYGFPVWLRDQTNPLYAIKPITGFVTSPGPNVVYGVTVPNHGIPVPYPPNPPQPTFRYSLQNVRILNVTSNKVQLNGSYGIISVPDANTIYLAGFPNPTGLVFLSGMGQLQQRGVVPFRSAVLERVTHRKRGRPFDAPRGRSRRRIVRGVY